MKRKSVLSALPAVFLLLSAAAQGDDEGSYIITIEDHQFSPKELAIPANQKVKITVKNLDSSAAEFESTDFNREKIVKGNGEVIVYIGPLDPGSYSYFDDFHHNATGAIIAK